jgi:hypothetical protein
MDRSLTSFPDSPANNTATDTLDAGCSRCRVFLALGILRFCIWDKSGSSSNRPKTDLKMIFRMILNC